jgi:tRNA-binding EMAP/Myf-like protein
MQGQVLVFANLKPRKLADFMSNGMVMANSNNDRSDIRLVNPKGKVGERIVL